MAGGAHMYVWHSLLSWCMRDITPHPWTEHSTMPQSECAQQHPVRVRSIPRVSVRWLGREHSPPGWLSCPLQPRLNRRCAVSEAPSASPPVHPSLLPFLFSPTQGSTQHGPRPEVPTSRQTLVPSMHASTRWWRPSHKGPSGVPVTVSALANSTEWMAAAACSEGVGPPDQDKTHSS